MKLSIITINYNNKAGLEKTIESVLSQTWRDFEWIIIDGGSTDGSKEVIESLTTNPLASNLISYWCSEPDKGIYNAMNKGIAKAKGDYINFMNSGDRFYENETLQKVSVYIEEGQFGILFGKMIEIQNGEEVIISEIKDNIYDIMQITRCGVPHQAMFYKNDIFDKFGRFDETLKYVSDWKHAIEAIYLGGTSIEIMPIKVSLYEGGGISTNDDMYVERKMVLNSFIHPELQGKLYTLTERGREIDLIYKNTFTRLLFRVVRKIAKGISNINK